MRSRSLADKLTMATMGVAVAALVLSAPVADARETIHRFPLEEALARAEASNKLASGVKLFFGKQNTEKPTKKLGPVRTNQKTNFFNKTDREACEHTFVSAMIAMTQYARRLDGNAIVNIRSNYKHHEVSSETEYVCGAGNITGGVAFVGEVVVLPESTEKKSE